MAYNRQTLFRTCSVCGGRGTTTYEEEDQTGATTRWVEATGSYRIDGDGKPVCKCGGQHA